MAFVRINPGDPIQAQNLNQVIDALNGVASKGQPIALTALNDAINYAETIQNLEPTNSRALNVLKSDGTTLIKADVTGVTLGSPLNLPTNSITSAFIADGTIQNVDLGPDVARLNLLTNPGYEIWQRGNGPFTSGFCADWWQIGLGGSSTVSVSNIVSTIGTPGRSAQLAYTHAAGGAGEFQQHLENYAAFAGKQITFSARVKSSVSGTVKLVVQDGVNNVSSAYNVGTGEVGLSVTVTVTGSPSYLFVKIRADVASCTIEVNDAVLVVGTQVANYVPMPPADDLARCQRYYQRLRIGARLPIASAANQIVATPIPFRAVTAVSPTVTLGTVSAQNNVQTTQFNSVDNVGAMFQVISNAAGDTYWYGDAIVEADP